MVQDVATSEFNSYRLNAGKIQKRQCDLQVLT